MEIWAQMDNNRPVVKAVKLIQSYLANSDAYLADKMQRCLKLQNKAEFLRLIATYSQVFKHIQDNQTQTRSDKYTFYSCFYLFNLIEKVKSRNREVPAKVSSQR